jgi:hypothetical protein
VAALLLIEGQDESYLIRRRAGIRSCVRARFWNWRLDLALARGQSPDSSEALSLRARALIGLHGRRKLARALRNVVQDAERPRHPFESRLPICRGGILGARPVLDEIADRLDAHGAIDVRGAAQLRVLLRDGSSPLYDQFHAEELIGALEAASYALEPDPHC